MIKKLLFSLFSIFLVYQSLELINLLIHINPAELSWTAIIVMSLLLNLFITGVFAFLGFVYKTNKLLPSSYYQIKNTKSLETIYRIFGVKFFKALLLKAFWGKEKNRKKYFSGAKTGIENFDFQTRQSEFGHLAALISVLIVSFISLIKGHLAIFILTTIINLIGNLYPIILQRTHRIQIERLTNLLEKRR
jgi:hypothetical protein